MATRIYNQYTRRPKSDDEINLLPSETVPGESMTMQQIFERYAKGQDLSDLEMKTSSYVNADLDSPDLEKLNRMELADRTMYIEELKHDINNRKAAIEAAEQKVKDDQKAKSERIKAKREANAGEPPVLPPKEEPQKQLKPKK